MRLHLQKSILLEVSTKRAGIRNEMHFNNRQIFKNINIQQKGPNLVDIDQVERAGGGDK